MPTLPNTFTSARVSFWRLATPEVSRVESIVDLAGVSYFEFFTPSDAEFATVRVGEVLGAFTYYPPMRIVAGALLSTGVSRVRVIRNQAASGGMRLIIVEEDLGTD